MHPDLRQLKYPKEFRIPPPVWSPALGVALEKVARLLEAAQATVAAPAPPPPLPPASPPPPSEPGREQLRLIRDTGTGLWRLKQKMLKPGTETPLPEMGRAYRHLQSIWDALAEAGVEIQDHTGSRFDSGMALKAIAFQPTPGIDRERVTETIKPSIYLNNRMIQMGEVIVATPADDQNKQDTKK